MHDSICVCVVGDTLFDRTIYVPIYLSIVLPSQLAMCVCMSIYIYIYVHNDIRNWGCQRATYKLGACIFLCW